ncbi:hypothetical protein Q3G72_017512 [Acer saccharum]|nr:hypothetical protein Q3G72_017512 [Acer saccharum]
MLFLWQRNMAEEVHQKYDFIDPHDPMSDGSPFIAESESPKHQYDAEYTNQIKATEGFHVDLIPIPSFWNGILPDDVNSKYTIEAANAAIEEFNRLNRLKGADLKLIKILNSNFLMVSGMIFFLTLQCSDGCFYEAKIYMPISSDCELMKFWPAKFWPRSRKDKNTNEEGGAEPEGSQIIGKKMKK